jgi:CRISPR-associated protein Cmr2
MSTDVPAETLWQTKLHARLHDPAEKALVLLRDPAGHEGGSTKVLRRLLGYGRLEADVLVPDGPESLDAVLFRRGVPRGMYELVRRADWWAAAADRPQWPMKEVSVGAGADGSAQTRVVDWAQVRWTREPVLIHPLTGAQFDLARSGGLGETSLDDIKSRSFEHFASLIVRDGAGGPDWRRTLLAFWRFGPELREDADNGRLGALWRLLPADTRVPDHGIWEHLDLVSAFAGAFAADPDGEAALLTLSIGPVQGFIEAARSTSDLWAGSHLLSRMAWEAMRPVCEALGPDAILFPKLRGVPQVDLWLRDACRLDPARFGDCEWTRSGTDSNPLFSAALPNRFVAIVPRARAAELAATVTRSVREWIGSIGETAVERLLAESGLADGAEHHCHRQMRTQLEGFPEVHWAAVPFSLIRARDPQRQTDLDTTALSESMAPFLGGSGSGFLDSPAWQVLVQDLRCDDAVFFRPNPGALYPAIYDLAERVHAAAKGIRSFARSEQDGYRCSLTGETEWLTTDPQQLQLPPGRRTDTLWTRLAERRPSWARKGEHLGALPAIKRVWPTLFAEEVAAALGTSVQRFVVSTRTMALAHQMERAIERKVEPSADLAATLRRRTASLDPAALPPRLARAVRASPDAAHLRFLPALLEQEDAEDDEPSASGRLVRDCLDAGRLETYYALLLLDGDRMGAWLSGGDEHSITYRDSFHPQVRSGFDERARRSAALRSYAEQPRALSPNRHLAISGALNDFSLHVARHVIEGEHLGRLLYAGGDDVLAMLPVADLTDAMQRLRRAYSGSGGDASPAPAGRLVMARGFAQLDGRLMRMMGEKATASCGAVVAHHQAPLGAVMRELRRAEHRAKEEGGRDALCITLVKRSGGTRHLVAKWGEPMAVLDGLIAFLREPAVSRRAVYSALEWLRDLPDDASVAMLATLLEQQWSRQSNEDARRRHGIRDLARRLATLAVGMRDRRTWLGDFLAVGEFLARESRAQG